MNLLLKHKLLFLPLILGVIILSLFYQKRVQPKISAAVFDRSINTVEGEPIKVVQVIDGDTIILANGDHLRYVGIDTPDEFDQRKPVQCFAREAAEAHRELVE